MAEIISFSSVAKTYHGEELSTEVFTDFSAKVERGEFAVLTGESGSGKTTLIKMLLADVKPDAGTVTVNGTDVSRLKQGQIPAYRRGLGVVFQDYKLVKEYSAEENIRLAIMAAGAPLSDANKKIWNVARLLGITELLKRKPDEMSGGQQQKICLARAIVNNPPILLADEPTANLDPAYSREIMRLFKIIHNMGYTLFVATQDPVIAEAEGVKRIRIRRQVL
ncbi:MAG: ATP-binding cassette domain-containing protein [Lachnospiraceae bacterium]|nr:ATP-binding cassette domain-containing protein [Lachnospiraceae bacterium]